MKGLKNFFYDKNDIVIALAVLLLAGLIIFWRMEVIMAYPQTLAAETDTTQTTEEKADMREGDKQAEAQGDKVAEQGGVFKDGVLAKELTVTVNGGSATSAVNCLIDAGLFASYDEYVEICKAAGYTPENIKAKTFTFASGSTQTDIAEEVTQ